MSDGPAFAWVVCVQRRGRHPSRACHLVLLTETRLRFVDGEPSTYRSWTAASFPRLWWGRHTCGKDVLRVAEAFEIVFGETEVVSDLVDECDPDLFVECVIGIEVFAVGVGVVEGCFTEANDAAAEQADVFGDGSRHLDGSFGEHDAGVEPCQLVGELLSPRFGVDLAPFLSERGGEGGVRGVIDDDGDFVEEGSYVVRERVDGFFEEGVEAGSLAGRECAGLIGGVHDRSVSRLIGRVCAGGAPRRRFGATCDNAAYPRASAAAALVRRGEVCPCLGGDS